MTRSSLSRPRPARCLLMLGASAATLAAGLTLRAEAQTAAARLAARVNAPAPPRQGPGSAPLRSLTAREALMRQRSTLSRAEQIRSYILSARNAAAGVDRGPVADGLGAGGLDPTGLVNEALAAARAGDTARAQQLLVSAGAANDPTGERTWQGAGLPGQTVENGRVKVVIDQTQERALLTWNSFNVGANTSLQFNQKANGVAQPGWVVVNRVSNSVAPSQILGNMTADGTVVVLNRAGVIFGKDAQVNTHSLLASTLELGQGARFVEGSTSNTRPTTVKERLDAYLQNGLFLPGNGTASAVTGNAGAALLVSAATTGDGRQFVATPEGAVTIDQGARLTSGSGGFVIVAAPTIDSAGILTATDGQVSLQAGRAVAYQQSTGAASDPDPFVRGYKLNSYSYAGQAGGSVVAGGLIDSTRGYISLGAGAEGSVTLTGLLSATTSVSRNGKVSLTAGTVTMAGNANPMLASGIVITADANGETIPQGSVDQPSGFKTSQIEIGTQITARNDFAYVGALVPTQFTMGQNALMIAPGANVAIGVYSDRNLSDPTLELTYAKLFPGRIDIAGGAVIDVSGLKDVQLDASRNQIAITPVKRNELRDTPNYREVALDGNFSLNGATLYVDPRLSGVRADGVRWVGSPLIEAGSLASQIPSTAAEFLTTGGSVTLGTTQSVDAIGGTGSAPSVTIRNGARIDVSGGWVSYAAGTTRTSRLVTNDGRVVDIGRADPNDIYVGVAEGFTEIQPRFGIVRNYYNAGAQGTRFDPAYDEGRDAGSLAIRTIGATIDGTLNGDVLTGARQVNAGTPTSLTSSTGGRARQRTPYEMPSGGALSVDTLGDVIVYHGTRGPAASNGAELLLNDAMLNAAGLSQLSINVSGAVTFADTATRTLQPADALTLTGASDLVLAPGGVLDVTAGRAIRFDGSVSVPSGAITARTLAPRVQRGAQAVSVADGSVFRVGRYGEGDGDDLGLGTFILLPQDPGDIRAFDITVNGTLSAAGQWINDLTEAGIKRGGAFRDGGSVSLTVAPRVFAAIGTSGATATQAVDLSGSIRVGGRIRVGAGGYVTPTGGLVLDGRGGDVSLINQTVLASDELTNANVIRNDGTGTSDLPVGGTNQSVEFTPLPAGSQGASAVAVRSQLVPTLRSTVEIAPGSIEGFGFAGGGTFTLVAPDISFGSDNRAGSTHIGLDFFRQTGFATLDVSSYRSRVVGDLFANDQIGSSAFLETTRFVVGAGETFDLTQWLLPSLPSSTLNNALLGLASGADLSAQSVLAPIRPDALWDRRAANLTLGGLTELDVLSGGRIIGSPEAVVTVSKLYNAGTIDLPGGTIAQRNDLVDNLVVGGLGVRDLDLGGQGLADAFGGPVDAQGRFSEGAGNAASVTLPGGGANARLLTNAELVSREGADRLIYFLGLADASQGIVLQPGSVTNLAGVALYDPRAPIPLGGARLRTGRVVAGGTISTGAGRQISRIVAAGQNVNVLTGNTLIRRDGAVLDISGANGVYDQQTATGGYVPYREWSGAGLVSALSGGSLGTTPILARGGDARAEGGTLQWLDPTIGDGSGSDEDGSDYLSAGMIAASGFDSVIARGSLTLDGVFSLNLRKALMVTSQDPLSGSLFDPDANVSIGATAGTRANLSAGYIRFASRLGTSNVTQTVAGTGTVEFLAGNQGLDIAGGIGFGRSIASLTLASRGDVRLIGVNTQGSGALPVYNGQLVAGGDLTIDARRTYATTGTGNLQSFLETGTVGEAQPFDIVALDTHSITFGNRFLDPNAPLPLSAGTRVRVLAADIRQNGFLAAPLGLLELGSTTAQTVGLGGFQSTPTRSVVFGAGSVTSVSGAGLNVPYGTTTDLIEYFFPTIGTPITRAPSGQLAIGGASIVQEAGARIDGRGGGDLFAYEFQSGVTGSRDVLDRFNRDPFSSNGFDPATGIGYQFADRRQVFALVPVGQSDKIAPYDPTYSADYGAGGPVDLYGSGAGRTVHLDGGNGVPAGDYLLVPAKYAQSIPGALRLVENTDAPVPLPGTSQRQLDGSVIVGGTFGFADIGISESTRRSFTVQGKDVFSRYSRIVTTSGSGYLTAKAAKAGTERPRLPIDAARVVLAPLSELRIAGGFDTRAAEGGRGGEFDIVGEAISVVRDGATGPATGLVLSDASLNALGATSLLIGGRRSEDANGNTLIASSATSLSVLGGASLRAPELLLVAGGTNAVLTIADGASLAGTGEQGTQAGGDYLIAGGGSLLRLASGGDRLVTRTGSGAATLSIGAASLTGGSLLLDSTGSFVIADAAQVGARTIAISGQALSFDGSAAAAGQAGAIGTGLEAKLAAAERLTVRSPGAIRFSAGTHRFNDLVLDTASLAATGNSSGADVTIAARDVTLLNAGGAADGCAVAGLCGTGRGFGLDANTVTFGANAVGVRGFGGGVSITGRQGLYVEGKGSFSAGDGGLTLTAPFLADRAEEADPREQRVRPDYNFLTGGDFTLRGAGTDTSLAPSGNGASGARIGIGTIDARVRSARIEGSLVRATAGIVDIQSTGDIALVGASLQTPGYEQTFGDPVDAVTVSAGGGTINLLSAQGNIAADAASRLVTDTGTGNAGTLNLLASKGTVALDAAINPDAKGSRQGSLAIDSGRGAIDLSGFVARYGTLFGGTVAIRSGAGNLDLAAGQTLKAKAVTLVADGGAIGIAGTIDTSGKSIAGLSADAARDAAVNGGDIALWGAGGVTLASTARLDTHTNGYADGDSRVAKAGDVSIGIGHDDAALTIRPGAVIDVGSRRSEAEAGVGRLVGQVINDPDTGTPVTVYRYAEPDQGGIVSLRAPVLGAARDKVAVSLGGTIRGASSIQLEGFQRYDLDALASGGYAGLTRGQDGTLILDMGAGGRNPFTGDFVLDDGTPSLVRFIQNFGVTTLDGSSLAGVRLRPGVELNSTGSIATGSQWNLGAASFSPEQLEAALADGVLRLIPELSTPGQPRYQVVPGREGDLLDRYARFLYRVGGTARGEAPVVTLRAGGDLTINRSISDGFFTFRDKSDPAYVNYQLGGGNRVYSPAIQFSCGGGSGSCADIPSYGAGTPGASGTLTITLNGTAQRGDQTNGAEYVNSPLPTTGNGPAGAIDAAGNPTGDPLGFGELFPLLSGDVAMHSSDIRLVAGSSPTLSANPLQVDHGGTAALSVTGDFTYRLRASGTASYGGPLQFQLVRNDASLPDTNFNIGDTLNQTDPTAGLDRLRDDAYTQLNWGTTTTGLSADARAAAQRYFAGKGYRFVGSANAPSGIIAPLSEVVAFLQSFEPTYQAGLASGRPGYTADRTSTVVQYGTNAQQNADNSPNQAHVRSYVRTGDGAIGVAASGDIDLRGGANAVYRREDGTLASGPSYTGQAPSTAAQFAAAAIYTAGVRVAPGAMRARIAGGALVSVTPDSPYLTPVAERTDFVPSPKALSDTSPVLARGGGDVSLDAGRDVLGRRDTWTELLTGDGQAFNGSQERSTGAGDTAGSPSQKWRTGTIGIDTEIGTSPRYFHSGVGALGGGDVSIRAGRDVGDLTVALLSGVTTTTAGVGDVMMTFGRGDLSLAAGRDILAGRFDIASGRAAIGAGRDIAAFGTEPIAQATPQYARIRLADAVVSVTAGGAATLGSVSALGTRGAALGSTSFGDLGSSAFFSPTAAFSASANEGLSVAETSGIDNYGQQYSFRNPDLISPVNPVQVLPPTLQLTSLTGSVTLPFGVPQFLYPSAIGQLRLYSAGDLNGLVVVMSDADPATIGGAFAAPRFEGAPLVRIPYVTANTPDETLRAQHNPRITHLGDPEPIRIYTGGDIDQSALFLPKQARITAGGDIVDMFFSGQNVAAGDVTRIRAGGDITGSTGTRGLKPFVVSNDFLLGGPGTLIVEAGRDLGPFVTSANIRSVFDGTIYSYGGGIRTVGNEYNPWLGTDGAKLSVRFGMAAGADYAALRDTYLNPANLANLDGDLFEQVVDQFGNASPDRSRPIYAPILARWLRDNDPTGFAAVFGSQSFPDTPAGNAALASAAYGRMADLYAAFSAIAPLRQQDFLVNDLYFNELAQPAVVGGASYLQYIRGYRAVQTLFPTRLGYTDNLAPYTTDPSTVNAGHPLGEPVRNIVNGQPQVADRVVTGNIDLRLATFGTARGGDITILGPGGDVIAGSVVRTAEQAQRRSTAFEVPNRTRPPSLEAGSLTPFPSDFASVPLGFEGLLTLRGGQVRSFTDGSFILNQSRVFTQQGGDITMWSSNGDLNAGQGPKSAANFPPVTVRFDENGLAEVNSAGSVAGAGIGTFQRTADDPPSDVRLLAPVGEVDAGDAGVRASGNVVVAAARVANADNFSAAGSITGVPTGAIAAAVALPTDAASAIAAQAAAGAANATAQTGQRRSLITVDVLGPATDCTRPEARDEPDCRRPEGR